MKDINRTPADHRASGGRRRPNWRNPDGFEPCPFCGRPPHIRTEDDEGNCRDSDPGYEKNPWSGLWYVIEHTRDSGRDGAPKNTGDIPAGTPCLIATEGVEYYGAGSVPNVGGDRAVFRTREDAVEWWNRMVGKCGRVDTAYLKRML